MSSQPNKQQRRKRRNRASETGEPIGSVTLVRSPNWSDEECQRRLREVFDFLLELNIDRGRASVAPDKPKDDISNG